MSIMKIAVVGGGLAGAMAAAHITRFFPRFELYHVHDASAPALDLGVATPPGFRTWLEEVTGLGPDAVIGTCNAGITRGIRFEGWSRAHPVFHHVFLPNLHGYHISTVAATELLRSHTRATVIDAPVVEVRTTATGVDVVMRGGKRLQVDVAFDARGWPRVMDERHVRLAWIPTNAACVRRGPARQSEPFTRSVARPHGWIFVAPLQTSTSYAYVFHGGASSLTEVEADFDAFLRAESADAGTSTVLSFPNFCHRAITDGAVVRIGNAASFIEPLGAPSISALQVQLMIASELLELVTLMTLLRGRERGRPRLGARHLARLNDEVAGHVLRSSLFVGWHYAGGAGPDTRFWRHAQGCFWHHVRALDDAGLRQELERYLAAGAALAAGEPHELWSRPFGGYTALSFAAVGVGLGHFAAGASA